MYKQTLTDLSKLKNEDVAIFMRSIDTVFVDCDGVLWLEDEVIQHTPQVLNKLRDMGKDIFFISNNSSRTRPEFKDKFERLGFQVNLDEIITTAFATSQYLNYKKNIKNVYIIGCKAIADDLTDVGIRGFGYGPDVLEEGIETYLESFRLEPNVGAVVVGFDPNISYIKLLKAGSYLADPKCLFIATNTDENFPAKGKTIPGAGVFVSAVATTSGRSPFVIGKPNPFIIQALLDNDKINPKRCLMIGDRCNTDILFGYNCGFQTLLVLSGVTKPADLEGLKQSRNAGLIADVYLKSLGHLLPLLNRISNN